MVTVAAAMAAMTGSVQPTGLRLSPFSQGELAERGGKYNTAALLHPYIQTLAALEPHISDEEEVVALRCTSAATTAFWFRARYALRTGRNNACG